MSTKKKQLVFQPLFFVSRATKRLIKNPWLVLGSGSFSPVPKMALFGGGRPILPYPYQVSWAKSVGPWKAPSAPRLFANRPPPEATVGEDYRGNLPGPGVTNNEFARAPEKQRAEVATKKGNFIFQTVSVSGAMLLLVSGRELYILYLLKCSPSLREKSSFSLGGPAFHS